MIHAFCLSLADQLLLSYALCVNHTHEDLAAGWSEHVLGTAPTNY